MMRKGISMKFLIMLHLKLLLERGKLASEAIGKVMRQHRQRYHHTLSCRSEKVNMSVICPRHYEFSCSNSPAYPSFYGISKSRNRSNKDGLNFKYDHRQIEQILYYNDATGTSPLTRLPGFGHSPKVRQLRVTDSPYSVKDMEEDDHQVDKNAEEFIKRFYKDLERQRLSSSF